MEWLQKVSTILTIFSGIITAISFFKIKDEKRESSEIKKATRLARIITWLSCRKKALIFTTSALAVATLAVFIPDIIPSGCNVKPPNNSPTPTISQPFTPPIVSPTPTSSDDSTQKKLYDLKPLQINDQSAFINAWNKENYKKLRVDEKIITSGIGIMIPKSNQAEYSAPLNTKRTSHKEVLEYKLCRKYKTLTFSYGVDDDSAYNYNRPTPACVCRIILECANSEQDFEKGTSILLFEDNNIYYSSDSKEVKKDVSNVNIIRFTFFWEYDPSSSIRNCLNLVIIDPRLTLK
jgi:hypothetical protein